MLRQPRSRRRRRFGSRGGGELGTFGRKRTRDEGWRLAPGKLRRERSSSQAGRGARPKKSRLAGRPPGSAAGNGPGLRAGDHAPKANLPGKPVSTTLPGKLPGDAVSRSAARELSPGRLRLVPVSGWSIQPPGARGRKRSRANLWRPCSKAHRYEKPFLAICVSYPNRLVAELPGARPETVSSQCLAAAAPPG
jgi:hypothetical protein